MISLSVHLFNTIMIILLPTAFSFTQTAPFTNLQLDPPQPPLQIYHHPRSATTIRLILIQVLYRPAKQSTTSLQTTTITMSTSERNPVDITLHQATTLALMEPSIANIREPLTEAELATYQRFVRRLSESAQAAQEACMAYEALVASKALEKPPAARTDPKMVALFEKNWAAFRAAAGGVTQAWASPDGIVDMHRREAKRVDGLKEEWKDEYERAGLVDKMVGF